MKIFKKVRFFIDLIISFNIVVCLYFLSTRYFKDFSISRKTFVISFASSITDLTSLSFAIFVIRPLSKYPENSKDIWKSLLSFG